MKTKVPSNEVFAVIDMQSTFPAAQVRDLVAAIEVEMAGVIARGGRIVSMNFDECGASTVQLPSGTPTIWKRFDDGGDELYAWLVGQGIVSRDLLVRTCGVNLSACVMSTASGLAKRLFAEHGMSDNVSIESSLCGDGARFRIRICP